MSHSLHTEDIVLQISGKALEVAFHRHPHALNSILLLHEALGSISYWRQFPKQLALATTSNVVLYSRSGHGNSEGPLAPRTDLSYRHEIETVIPAILHHFHIQRPVVYGHSEGAGIAILYAAASLPVKSLVLESPFIVARTGAGRMIDRMAADYPASQLSQRLAKYHQDPDAVFYSWAKWAANLSAGELPLAAHLSTLSCPVLVLQGVDDPFGTSIHLEAILAALPPAHHERIEAAGHLPHREQTERTLELIARFLASPYPPQIV